MEYRFRIEQDELKRIFETATERMDAHPDIADKHKDVIEKCHSFKNEKEALEAAIALKKADELSNCQIWAKIEKDADIYRIVDWWLMTDDWKVKQAADYIGLALMYDDMRLQKIIDNHVKIDDVVAYW